jgi:hypothetical protein
LAAARPAAHAGSGLKRLRHGDFCGSPKWSSDGTSVVVYCMPAEDTWTFRVALRRGGLPEVGETTLTRIDIATGEAKPVSAGPGVKMFPSVLPSGEVAFLRADKQAQGVFYATGKPGPVGDARWPAWSPDGKRVVYGRETSPPPGAPRKLWSKNPQYELFSTGILPAYDRSGEGYVATAIAPNRRDTTLMLGAGDGPPKPLLESITHHRAAVVSARRCGHLRNRKVRVVSRFCRRSEKAGRSG